MCVSDDFEISCTCTLHPHDPPSAPSPLTYHSLFRWMLGTSPPKRRPTPTSTPTPTPTSAPTLTLTSTSTLTLTPNPRYLASQAVTFLRNELGPSWPAVVDYSTDRQNRQRNGKAAINLDTFAHRVSCERSLLKVWMTVCVYDNGCV